MLSARDDRGERQPRLAATRAPWTDSSRRFPERIFLLHADTTHARALGHRTTNAASAHRTDAAHCPGGRDVLRGEGDPADDLQGIQRDLSRNYGDRGCASSNYLLVDIDGKLRLELLLVDRGGAAHRINSRVRRVIAQRKGLPKFHALMKAGRFRITVLTGTQEQASKIERRVDRRPFCTRRGDDVCDSRTCRTLDAEEMTCFRSFPAKLTTCWMLPHCRQPTRPS